MSIQSTLKRVFNIQSDTQEGAKKILREDYSQGTTTVREINQINEQIGNSAMWIKGNEEDGYFLMIANYKVTRKIATLTIARTIGEQTDWENIINAIAAIIETAFIMERGYGVNSKETKVDATPVVG